MMVAAEVNILNHDMEVVFFWVAAQQPREILKIATFKLPYQPLTTYPDFSVSSKPLTCETLYHFWVP